MIKLSRIGLVVLMIHKIKFSLIISLNLQKIKKIKSNLIDPYPKSPSIQYPPRTNHLLKTNKLTKSLFNQTNHPILLPYYKIQN